MDPNQEQTQEELDEFASAFNEEEGAEGATHEADEAAAGGEEGEGPEADASAEPGQSGGGDDGAQASTVVLQEGAESAPAAASTPEDIEKERQRLKSWEGRLKAREQELAGKKGAEESPAQEQTSEALEGVAEAAGEHGSEEMAAAAEAAAEAVENGEMTPAEAMKQLQEDFGEEFIKLIVAVVKGTAKDAVDPVAKKADATLAELHQEKERAHFGAIATKHPDFREIGQSADFKAYVDGLPEAERAEAQRVAQAGKADEVINLLDKFKSRSKPVEPPAPPAATQKTKPAPADTSVDAEAEAMEGVRSGGVRLPERPQPASDDFAAAWEQF